jgi:CO/xanthine dehydrogenase Mo-binding subunit
VAEKLRGRVLDEAALAMNCAASDLIMADGLIKPKYGPQRQLSYGEVARLFKQQNGADLAETETFHATANPGSYAAHFVAVEVDTLTGRVKVLEVLAAHDIGQPLNRQLVEGQVHGGIQMGMGLALLEDLDIDASGATKGDSFARYHQVNASDMPPVEVLLIDEIEDSGPFGAKALGEIAAVPTAPAIVNAVNHALGTSLCDLPLTPERVVAAVLEAAPPGGA